MVTNCALLARGDELLLIDTGIGDKNDAKFRDLFGMEEGAARLPEQIRARRLRAGRRHPRPPHPPPLRPQRLEHPRGRGRAGADLPQRPLLALPRRGGARPAPQRARPGELRSAQLGAAVRRRGGGAVRRRSRAGGGRAGGQGPRPQRRHVRGPDRRRNRRGGRQGGFLGRPGAHRGARPLPVDHELRPLPADHPREQEAVAAPGGGRELALHLRARPGDAARPPGGDQAGPVRGRAGPAEPVADERRTAGSSSEIDARLDGETRWRRRRRASTT